MVNDSSSFHFYKNLLFVPNFRQLKVHCDIAFACLIDTTPVIIASICYYKIYKVVFNSKQAMNKASAGKHHHDKSIYRTLIITLVAVIFTCTPIALAVMSESLLGLDMNIYIYRLATFLVVGGSFINPLIFAFFNRQFREAYVKLFSKSKLGKFFMKKNAVVPAIVGTKALQSVQPKSVAIPSNVIGKDISKVT